MTTLTTHKTKSVKNTFKNKSIKNKKTKIKLWEQFDLEVECIKEFDPKDLESEDLSGKLSASDIGDQEA